MPQSSEDKLSAYQLDGSNLDHLRAAGKLLIPELDRVLGDFYVRARANPEAAAFFDSPDHMDRARNAQKLHWERILRSEFDAEYFASIERIGRVHARIDLPINLYMSAYTLATSDLITIFLNKSRKGFRPWQNTAVGKRSCTPQQTGRPRNPASTAANRRTVQIRFAMAGRPAGQCGQSGRPR